MTTRESIESYCKGYEDGYRDGKNCKNRGGKTESSLNQLFYGIDVKYQNRMEDEIEKSLESLTFFDTPEKQFTFRELWDAVKMLFRKRK